MVVFVNGVVPPVLHIDRPNSTEQKLETSFIKLGNCVKGDDVVEAAAKKQKEILQYLIAFSQGFYLRKAFIWSFTLATNLESVIFIIVYKFIYHVLPPFNDQSNVFHLVFFSNFNVSTIRNQFFGKGLPKDIVINFKSVAKD